jgi:hypothetical protein
MVKSVIRRPDPKIKKVYHGGRSATTGSSSVDGRGWYGTKIDHIRMRMGTGMLSHGMRLAPTTHSGAGGQMGRGRQCAAPDVERWADADWVALECGHG